MKVVSIYYLRESRHSNLNKRNPEMTSMLEFKIPEHLKVMPNDSQEERERKKKKLKHLKQNFKNSIIDRDMQNKRGKWNEFNETSKVHAKGHFQMKKNTESIFKTPETLNSRVGVMNSGRGMTTFLDKEKHDKNRGYDD